MRARYASLGWVVYWVVRSEPGRSPIGDSLFFERGAGVAFDRCLALLFPLSSLRQTDLTTLWRVGFQNGLLAFVCRS